MNVLAESMRQHLDHRYLPEDQKELFSRMVFNILVNNDDNHSRNHSFVLGGTQNRVQCLDHRGLILE
ncbi:HipA domain-containing protein [Pseudomonas cavernicola]|uniref:HipA domain-containing protein n=2 Tax=Pseudomonas cavernicola TaxID=2320866 RepID=A0A418XME9_9PSED|nr:HipA domain-containing protein [Pseudomonas cavernicola]